MNGDQIQQIKSDMSKSLEPLVAPVGDFGAVSFKQSQVLLKRYEKALGLKSRSTDQVKNRLGKLHKALEALVLKVLPDRTAVAKGASEKKLRATIARQSEAIKKLELLGSIVGELHNGAAAHSPAEVISKLKSVVASMARSTEGSAPQTTPQPRSDLSEELEKLFPEGSPRIPTKSFNRTRKTQEFLANADECRFGTRAEHLEFTKYLLTRSEQGTLNRDEVKLLALYETKFIRDRQGGLDIRDGVIREDQGGWNDIAHPSSGAFFVPEAGSKRYGSIKRLLHGNFLGAAEWARGFGVDVGKEPAIPDWVTRELLESRCNFFPSVQVKDSHILMLIPKTLDGKPFSLNVLLDLYRVQKRRDKYRVSASGEKDAPRGYQAPPADSEWILIPKCVQDRDALDEHDRFGGGSFSCFPSGPDIHPKLYPDYSHATALELLSAVFLNHRVHREQWLALNKPTPSNDYNRRELCCKDKLEVTLYREEGFVYVTSSYEELNISQIAWKGGTPALVRKMARSRTEKASGRGDVGMD
jgi:hypothetical protein